MALAIKAVGMNENVGIAVCKTMGVTDTTHPWLLALATTQEMEKLITEVQRRAGYGLAQD